MKPISDVPAWHGCHWPDGQLVLPFDAENLTATVAGHEFHYDLNDGLAVRRIDE